MATSSAALGQDWDDADEPQPRAQNVPSFVLNEATFGQWAFGVQDLRTVRSRMDAILALKIHSVDRVCELTTDQEQKLKLAGRGDLKRIWERVEDKRRKYVDRPHDQTKVNDIIQDVQSLRAVLTSDPFGDETLFAKTLHAMLNDEQTSRYAKAEQEKNQQRRRTFVNLAVAYLDQAAGFTDEQRRRLSDLLLQEIAPPTRVAPYALQIAMVQVARISEDKLRGLFDDVQWRVVQRRLDQARRSEPALIRQGVLPPNGAARAAGARDIQVIRGR